jgi:hypothetical protein
MRSAPGVRARGLDELCSALKLESGAFEKGFAKKLPNKVYPAAVRAAALRFALGLIETVDRSRLSGTQYGSPRSRRPHTASGYPRSVTRPTTSFSHQMWHVLTWPAVSATSRESRPDWARCLSYWSPEQYGLPGY